MKVLMINSVCGIKSTGRICTDLAEILEKNGHTCKIAYGREAVPAKYEKHAHKIGGSLNTKLHGLKARLFDAAGFGSKAETRKLVKWIKDYDPDVIHLHNLHGYYINVNILFDYLKKAGKPVVWTLHDCWPFTGHCSYFNAANCYKWKTQCNNCPQKKAYPSSLLFDRSRSNYEIKKRLFTSLDSLVLITPSEWLAHMVRSSFFENKEVVAIPNGVDLGVFRPIDSDFLKKYDLLDKKVVLGVATSWSERKGLKIFAEISQKLPSDYKVVLVGVTAEAAKDLPENILVIPKTNNVEELAQIYTAADVLLNPSTQETMGLTTVEAMACGTPAAVSNLTAVPEVIDENGGIVLDDLSAETIIKGIESVLGREYPNTRATAEKYEKEQQYLKYIAIYEKLLFGENNENS